jgi:uncharacterized protein (DUF4415 family)
MPTPSLDEPIKKVTFNMYHSDYAAFIRYFGDGWSSKMREVVREWVRENLQEKKDAR